MTARRDGPLDDETLEAFQATYAALHHIEMALSTIMDGPARGSLSDLRSELRLLRNFDQRLWPRLKSEDSN